MIVNCVAYQDGRKVADIPPEAISEYVGRPGHLVWVALKDPEEAELRTMQEEFGLHELAVEDALKGNQRAKVEEYGDTLFVVANTVEVVEGEIVVGEVDIFVGPAYVLSVRTRASQGFVSHRKSTRNRPANTIPNPAQKTATSAQARIPASRITPSSSSVEKSSNRV